MLTTSRQLYDNKFHSNISSRRLRGLLRTTAISAIAATSIWASPAAADMTFNYNLSKWDTTSMGDDQIGTGGFVSLAADPANINDPAYRVFSTGAPTGVDPFGRPTFDSSTRLFVGGGEPNVPQAAGNHAFTFSNMGVLSGIPSAQSVASYDLSASAGETSDINKGDYAKLVFDVTSGQDLNFLAAMGNVTNMTIITIGDPADGNKQITVVLQIVDTVASAADPDGSIVSAAGALAFSMDKNAAGTAYSLTPDQGKTIFQTDFFYQDLTVPTLDAAGTGVAIRADGVLGIEGTFTALIPETTIAALGLDPQTVGGSSDETIPDGFSFSQNGARSINGQTYYSYSIKNSAWSEHDLQFGQSSGNTVIDSIIADQGSPYSLVKEGPGTLSLTGNNTFSGGVTVAGGILSLQHNNAAGTGNITTTGSVVDFADGVNISNPILVNSYTTQLQVLTGSAEQSGIISETGGARPFEKIGAGTLTLSATNTYSGTTTITDGTLVAGAAGALGATSGDIVINGGSLNLGGTYHTKQDVVLNAGTIQNGGLNAKTYARTGGSASVTISADISVTAVGGTIGAIGTDGVVVANTTSSLTQTFNRVAITNTAGAAIDVHATGSGGISSFVLSTITGSNTGVLARATTGNIDVNAGKNISSSANSSSGGGTYNTLSSGIWAETTTGQIYIHGSGDINTSGNGSRTINAIMTDTGSNTSNDIIIDMSGTISNSGAGPGSGLYTRGIYVDRRAKGSGTVEITTGNINLTNVTNENAGAISASQGDSSGVLKVDTTAGTLNVSGSANAGAVLGINVGTAGSGGIDIKSGEINIVGGTNNSSYGGIGILASSSKTGAPINIETFGALNGGQGGIRVFGPGYSGAGGDVTINTRAKIGDITQPEDYGIHINAHDGATKIHLGQHADGTLVAAIAADLKSAAIGILTQVKGSGSLEIDSRGQTITAGDIGIRVLEHGTGKIDINTGAVNGTGHGIIAHAGTGIKNITNHGAVVGGGYGIAAENTSGTGKVTVTANAAVTGQTQSGISVINGTGDIAINSTNAIESFTRAINAETSSGAISIVNSGTATTTSTGSDAYTVYAKQTGTGATSNGISINQTGEVNNAGRNSTRGIHALRYAAGAGTVSVTSGDVNITNVSNGNVAAIQAHQDNAASTGKAIVDSTAGTLTVNGTSNPYALFGITAGNYGSGGIDIDSGVIVLNVGSGAPSGSGYSGVGIFASTGNNGIQNSSITIDAHGTISGGWKGIQALTRADNSNIDIVTNGAITSSSNMGIEASNGFLHTGAVENAGLTGAIHVTNKASIGDGTAGGNPDYGIVVRGGNGTLEVDVDGSINADLTGVYAQTEGSGTLNIDSTGQTIVGGSEGINANIHKGSGQIDIVTGTTTGTSKEAIKVNAGTGVKNITTHGATTGGTYGINVANANGTGKVTIVANANVTGQSQRGINVDTGSGDVDVSSSAGTIQGSTNGLVVTTNSGDVKISASGNVVGINGDALAGISTTGNVDISGSGNVTGNYRAISTNTTGNITISGTGKATVNGPGNSINNVGAITATIGTVTGDRNLLINRSGAVSNLSNQNVKGIYAANNSTGAGDITIATDGGTGTYGSVVIDGNSNSASVGIYAERHNATKGGDVIIHSGAVTVNGDTGFGIEGLGYDASNVNITNHGAVNGGHIGIGGFTYGTGTVTIETAADIGNANAPTSYGVLARADGTGNVSVMANNIVTSDGVAISADNFSNGGTGDVSISGSGALSSVSRGIQALTNGGAISITGSGDVTASGASSMTIFAKSASGGASDLTINRSGAITNTGAGDTKGIVAQHLGAGTGNLNIDTRAGSISINGSGATKGIYAVTDGQGKIDINAGAIDITSDNGIGIHAVSSFSNGNSNDAAIEITANGFINGGDIGILAEVRNAVGADGDITIITNSAIGAGGTDKPVSAGIKTISKAGATKITTGGSILSQGDGIKSTSVDGNIVIELGANIYASDDGINASATGAGSITVQGAGDISSGSNVGDDGIDISTVGGNATVSINGTINGAPGIVMASTGGGDLIVTGTGDVVGTLAEGIKLSSTGSKGAISVDRDGDIVGQTDGLKVKIRNKGGTASSTIKLRAGRKITGTTGRGIYSFNGAGLTSFDIKGAVSGATNGLEFEAPSGGEVQIKLSSAGSVSGNDYAIKGTASGKVSLTNAGLINGLFSAKGINATTSFFTNSGSWNAFGGSSVFAGSFTNTGTFNLQNGSTTDTFTTGNLALSAGSFLKIDVNNANQSDSIAVAGSVSLGGTLDVNANGLDTDYVRGIDYAYQLITNDGNDAVSGNFDAINTNFAFLIPTIDLASGDGNDVTLLLHAKSDRPDFKPHAVGGTQMEVATAIDGMAFDGTDGKEVLDAVEGLTTQQASVALDQFGGSDHAASEALGHQSSVAFNGVSIARRGATKTAGTSPSVNAYASFGAPKPAMAAINEATQPATPRYEIWGKLFASRTSINIGSSSPSLRSDNAGLIFGGEFENPYSAGILGMSFGYSNSNFSTKTAGSSSGSDNYHVGAYGFWGAYSASDTGFGLLSAVNYTRHDYVTKRAFTVGNLGRIATAKYHGETFGGDMRLRYGFELGDTQNRIVFAPIAGINFAHTSNQSYTETGAGILNLSATGTNVDRYSSLLGFEISNQLEVSSTPIEATLSVGWRHDFGNVSQTSSYSFVGSPTQFSASSPKQSRNHLSVSTGLQVNPTANTTLSFSGMFEKSKTSEQLGADITLKLRF